MRTAERTRCDLLLLDVNPLFPPIVPLGLEVLAGALRQSGFSVRIVSASPLLASYSAELDALRTLRPAAVGLQIRNYDRALLRPEHPTLVSYYRGVASRLRALFGDAPLILGGIGFSIDPALWLRELGAEFGVSGSAEVPLVALLRVVLRGEGSLTDVPNLVLPGRPVAPPTYAPATLDRVDRSGLELAPWQDYAARVALGVPWANVEIQRGCPFRCAFCVEPRVHGRRVAHKAPHDVIAELRQLVERGVADFFFCNSEFNLHLTDAIRLCDELARSDLAGRIRWTTYLIPHRVPVELTERMVSAGCVSASFNAIHVSDPILASFHAPHRRRHLEASLAAARRAGLPVSATFLVGSGLESDATLAELTAFIDGHALRSCLALGLAHYANLPASAAFAVDAATRVFRSAGNRTIPYSLRLSAAQVSGLAAWAATRPSVTLQHDDPETLAGALGAEDGAAAAAPSSSTTHFDQLVQDAASQDQRRGAAALRALRHALPLVDLPIVPLGHGLPPAAPMEPRFRLAGPYHALGAFHEAFARFVRSAPPDAVARLLVRFAGFAGEFPRLLEVAGPELDAGAAAWLAETWAAEHALPQLVFAASYACQARCPYCYKTDVDRDHPGALTLENFLAGLEWGRRHGCRVISFVGGEPTLHPAMPDFLRHVRDAGMKTYFNSNLLCPTSVLALMDGSWVVNVGIHAQASRYVRPEQRTSFAANVELLKRRGVFLFLRYNFERTSDEEIEAAIDLARTLGVPQVNFAIPMPALSRRNRHAVEEELLASGAFLVRATEAFRSERLRPVLSKPIPPCALPEDRLGSLGAGEALSSACNLPQRAWTQNVLVGPDLSISPCVGVATRGPSLLEFDNFEEIAAYMVDHLRRILRPVPFDRCYTCNFYLDRRCLGGCLAYFTDGEGPAPSPGARPPEGRTDARAARVH